MMNAFIMLTAQHSTAQHSTAVINICNVNMVSDIYT